MRLVVNRILRALRVQSIAELRGGTVTVHDWKQLVKAGDFDDAFLLLNKLPVGPMNGSDQVPLLHA